VAGTDAAAAVVGTDSAGGDNRLIGHRSISDNRELNCLNRGFNCLDRLLTV
jgi:hypothetical protein